MVEQEAVNFKVLGSNPSRGANLGINPTNSLNITSLLYCIIETLEI